MLESRPDAGTSGLSSIGVRSSKKIRASKEETNMVKVSVFYPFSGGAKFDMAYFLEKHMPLVRQKLGLACKGVSVEQGLAGGAPGTAPTYTAMAHMLFDSAEAFQAAFAPHAPVLLGDIPNYTAIQPIIQISEVKM